MGKERDQFFSSLSKNLTSNPTQKIKIGDRLVGGGEPAYIIAEVGANHRGDINNAFQQIEAAAKSGADAVKFQHIKAETMAADTKIDIEWNGKKEWRTLSEFYRKSEMPYEWTDQLIEHCQKNNITFLSTPFDLESIDLLAKSDVPALKVASYELTSDQFLIRMAQKGKPIILSTGMAYLEEVAHAVKVIQEAGNQEIALLHCVSIYPPKNPADINLPAISTMHEAFKLPIGYSDHSKPTSNAAVLGAVAKGACIIERHFTNTREGGSHDDPNSVQPEEFKKMVEEIRELEEMLAGSGIKQPVSYEGHDGDEISDRWARRSIYASTDIPVDTEITEEMVQLLRPSDGIDPRHLPALIGKKPTQDIKARQPITWNLFE